MSTDNSLQESSFDQIQNVIQQKLKNEGVIDSLKMHIRQDILQLLQGQNIQKKPPQINFDKLWTKLTLQAVAEFLKVHNYQCSLAIFLPEAQLPADQQSDCVEICNLFGLDIRDYSNHLLKISAGRISAIEILIKYFQHTHKVLKHDHSCQTDPMIETYHQKMGNLERDYLRKLGSSLVDEKTTIEDRVNQVRKECEERYKALLHSELERMKSIEIQNQRLEERTRFQRTIQEERKKLQQEYEGRLGLLKEKEETILRRLQLKLQEAEKDQLAQRQKIIEELDYLEKEKIKFHRHKCEESDQYKKNAEEVEILRRELQQKLKETEDERQSYRKKQGEFFDLSFNVMKKETKENIEPNHQQLVVSMKELTFQKEQIQILERQRSILNQERDSLEKENRFLKQENQKLQDIQSSIQRQVLKLQDELNIEKDHSTKLERQINSFELERSQQNQIIRDLNQRLDLIREEQINTHKKYGKDMDTQHQQMLLREKEIVLNIQEQTNNFREERQELLEAQNELEHRIEELMEERDNLRNLVRDLKWEKQYQHIYTNQKQIE